jgi:hypothetical protein
MIDPFAWKPNGETVHENLKSWKKLELFEAGSDDLTKPRGFLQVFGASRCQKL